MSKTQCDTADLSPIWAVYLAVTLSPGVNALARATDKLEISAARTVEFILSSLTIRNPVTESGQRNTWRITLTTNKHGSWTWYWGCWCQLGWSWCCSCWTVQLIRTIRTITKVKYTFLDWLFFFRAKNYLKPSHLLSLAIHSPPSHRHSDGLHKSEIVKSSVQQEFLQWQSSPQSLSSAASMQSNFPSQIFPGLTHLPSPHLNIPDPHRTNPEAEEEIETFSDTLLKM